MYPGIVETSSTKVISFTPLITFALVMADVAVGNGITSWSVIWVSLLFGNLAGFAFAVADRHVTLSRWQVKVPGPWWNWVSPAIYLAQRGRVTSEYDWNAFRPLWRWCASAAIVSCALFLLTFYGGALLLLHEQVALSLRQ